ncbi:unnamed protein product [Meganyctiphanes norvegica]|uniref:Uncharacterized protein n=1 Tax=Meganyctiphanes norvegica TaxID=48144 RepID=A0AAV2PRA9_MEGNR
MADHSKRTTVLLTVVAILFILTIIILCLPYDIGHTAHKGGPSATDRHRFNKIEDTTTITPSTTTRITSSQHPTDPQGDVTSESDSTTLFSEGTTIKSASENYTETSSTELPETSVNSTSTTEELLTGETNCTAENGTMCDEKYTESQDNSTSTTEELVTDDTNCTAENGTMCDETYTESQDNSTSTTEELVTGDTNCTAENGTMCDETYTESQDNSTSTTEELLTGNATSTSDEAFSTSSLNTTENGTETTETLQANETSSEAVTETTVTTTTPMSTIPTTTTLEPYLDEPECTTTQCKDLAAKMWLLRDNNTNPCEDFYQYACGGAVDNKFMHPVDATEATKWKIQDNIQQGGDDYDIAKNFYDSCLRQDSIQAREQWENTSNWMDGQVTKPTSCNKDGLTTLLANLIKNNFVPLFDVSLGLDTSLLDSSVKFVFRVTPPVARSPFGDDVTQVHCLKQYQLGIIDKVNVDVEDKYRDYLQCKKTGTGKEARLDSLRTYLNHINVTQDQVEPILDFLNKTNQLNLEDPFTSEDMMRPDYQIKTVQNLNDEFGDQINWQNLLSELVGESHDLATSIVQLYRPEYLKKIIQFLTDQTRQSKPVCDTLVTLWKEARYTDLVSPQSLESTLVPYSEEYCLELTTSLLPELLYSLDETHYTADIEKVSEVTENMNTSLINRVASITGEHHELQKFDLKQRSGKEFSLLRSKKDMSTVSFQEKSLLLLQRFRSVLYNDLYKNTLGDQQNRLIHFTFENAAYHPPNKYFPASYLEAPYYMEKLPAYLSYAGLGAAIAQSVLRAQQQHTTDGNCLVKDYFQGNTNSTISMKMHLESMKSEAKVTHMAWAGYIEAKHRVSQDLVTQLEQSDFAPLPWLQLTPTQLFYLRSAQMHCEKTSTIDLLALKEQGHIPGPIRVNKILVTETRLREAFSCPDPQEKQDICESSITTTSP